MKKTFDISSVEGRKDFVTTLLNHGKLINFQKQGGTNWSMAIVQFPDGWSTHGTSVCVSAADFDAEKGKQIAYENALDNAETHYWRAVGYMAMIGMKEIEIPWEE